MWPSKPECLLFAMLFAILQEILQMWEGRQLEIPLSEEAYKRSGIDLLHLSEQKTLQDSIDCIELHIRLFVEHENNT